MTSEYCPIRWSTHTNPRMPECVKSCAWFVGGGCIVQQLPELTAAIRDLDNTLFNTLGSAKAGDALDAVRNIAQMMEVRDA